MSEIKALLAELERELGEEVVSQAMDDVPDIYLSLLTEYHRQWADWNGFRDEDGE